ncbi:MAG: type II toxin-antitoxin system Phd/YefM family antitoxin [Treponema sp.]|nr:type II toxin-antitoxin system Phd/YefM family antitoxin [Treponema sp.]
MISIPMFEVKNKLTQFVHMVENGETDCVEITRHGKAVAVIGKKEEFKVSEQADPFFLAYKSFREKMISSGSDLSEAEWHEYFDIPRQKSNLRHPEDFE